MQLPKSVGLAPATVLLETLKMSPDMVGMLSEFDMFTRNASAAYDVTYSMLEQLDAARETDMIRGPVS